jgi:hypothetical protein
MIPRLPFSWGAGTPAEPPPPPPEPPFWGPVTSGALAWQAVRAGQMPRFEHVFPQESGSEQQFVKITEPPFGTP